jgi:molybdopterin-guanine dinucleotide biosynthesis protein MobB
MAQSEAPTVVAIVGRKNSGKTTLLVAVAAELRRRGYRVASMKHGHHRFEIDHEGRDSWRHVHEGGVEAVLLVSAGKIALVMDAPEEPDPETLLRRHYAGQAYDVVLVEGYKDGPFPKVEIHRREAHDRPLHDPDAPGAVPWLAIVTDDPEVRASAPVIPLRAGDPGRPHVAAVVALVEERIREGRGDAR